jgi:hypothetical protein
MILRTTTSAEPDSHSAARKRRMKRSHRRAVGIWVRSGTGAVVANVEPRNGGPGNPQRPRSGPARVVPFPCPSFPCPPSALVASRSSRPCPNMACHRPCASQVVFRPRNTTRLPSRKVECPGPFPGDTVTSPRSLSPFLARPPRDCLVGKEDLQARSGTVFPDLVLPRSKLAGVSPAHVLRSFLCCCTRVGQDGIASVGLAIYKLNTPDPTPFPSSNVDCQFTRPTQMDSRSGGWRRVGRDSSPRLPELASQGPASRWRSPGGTYTGAYRTMPGTRSKSPSWLARRVRPFSRITATSTASRINNPDWRLTSVGDGPRRTAHRTR